MYLDHYNLNLKPFEMSPDPRFLWLTDTHEEGLAALYYGITRRKGFILLTGEVGAGKTTLLRAALGQIPEETESALVMNTAGLGPLDQLEQILQVQVRGDGPADIHQGLDILVVRLRFHPVHGVQSNREEPPFQPF